MALARPIQTKSMRQCIVINERWNEGLIGSDEDDDGDYDDFRLLNIRLLDSVDEIFSTVRQISVNALQCSDDWDIDQLLVIEIGWTWSCRLQWKWSKRWIFDIGNEWSI